ncbi:hypothetical protein [Pseudomonas sp.]|uniref:hypothetical protein n=1 Tax=Pseudomonas sp. TaxID=306 RepID=UPI0029BDEB3F|nr:hypothetical protein [Pseudomonas sp.]MDX3740189.1 hypothetical protein [Pseudomonas sp.]
MIYRNEKGQFITEKQAIAGDLTFFISEWKRWALEAFRKGDREDGRRCMAEMRDCRQKLREVAA